MCKKAVVFAGTTEGRKIAEYLSRAGVKVAVSAATEYGGGLMEESAYLRIHTGRMDAGEMERFLEQENPEIVLDATHPYATEVTENIKIACRRAGVEYLRLLRETVREKEAVYVADVKEAAEYLNHTTGNVLLTVGSKELAAFTEVEDYQSRLYARVLSLPDVVAECDRLGFCGKHLFAMQGPFSAEMNLAMLRQIQAAYLVTKETGTTGGFEEKCRAAKENGTKILVIGKPKESVGVSFAECVDTLNQIYGMERKQEISLIGIGTGNRKLLTEEAKEAFLSADVIIGARRMVQAVCREGQEVFYAYLPQEIEIYCREHPNAQKIAVALSGDAGFYSGAKKLLEVLPEHTKVIPGVSSLVYFAAKLKTSWEDITCASLHGKQDNVIGLLRTCAKVFVLLGKPEDARNLCRRLTAGGMGDTKVSIGENLSYPEEKITIGTAETLTEFQTSPLCVCLLEREPEKLDAVTYGMADSEFVRGDVPMTKEEVRSIVLSKLCLRADSVFYDIGAGTGSVSVEAARMMPKGMVYAIEKNSAAIALLKENKDRFAVENMQMVEGTAPEALEGLPAPTHAFIGGSSGNLREILQVLFSRNPKIRVVAAAVSLETVAGITRLLPEIPVSETDAISVTVAKARELGKHHLMMGQNPVYVFSFQGGV